MNSVIVFALKFYFILLLKTCLVFIFQYYVLNFNNLPFVLTVGVIRIISEPDRSYSKLYKTAPIAIIFPTAL